MNEPGTLPPGLTQIEIRLPDITARGLRGSMNSLRALVERALLRGCHVDQFYDNQTEEHCLLITGPAKVPDSLFLV